MEPFDLLLHDDAIMSLRKIRGVNRKEIVRFLNTIPQDPYLPTDSSYQDLKGRIVFKKKVRSYIVDYIIDDPVQEIKVIGIVKVV